MKVGRYLAVTQRRRPGIFSAETRTNLHRIAAHVLGRRRHDATGRFGLRAAPGGFGTPAFGDPLEVVRVSGLNLVHELGASSRAVTLSGSTLRALAVFVGTDIGSEFCVGPDTPDLGDPDEPVRLDARTSRDLASWFSLGSVVLDRYVAETRPEAATTIQLWPEHFDAATSVTLAKGNRVNLGFSAGDGFEPEPYAYFGPWGSDRPGDASYWNAPFGAVLRRADVVVATDSVERVMAFLQQGSRFFERT